MRKFSTVTTVALLAAMLLAAGAAGCSQHSASSLAATAGVPMPQVPVGPNPGPQIPGQQAARNAPNPFGQDDSALQDGRKLFVAMNCSGCHGGHAGGGMGPSLRDKSWIYGGSPPEVFASIAQGRAHGMPSWRNRIPEDQIWKIVAYIEALETEREPEPPSPAPPHAPDTPPALIH